jgi:hypothetical protein
MVQALDGRVKLRTKLTSQLGNVRQRMKQSDSVERGACGRRHWLAILLHDICCEGQNFHLLFYRNLSITFPLSVEVTRRHFTKSVDGNDLCACEPIFRGELRQRLFRFVIFIEYERESFPFSLCSNFDFIPVSLMVIAAAAKCGR